MQNEILTVRSNEKIARDVYRMTLSGASCASLPGQFISLKIDGYFLRRPISVCDQNGDIITIIYKTVGAGTQRLSRTSPGEKLDALTELGNGYDLSCAGDMPLVIGGGVGVPPMYLLARHLLEAGKAVTAILGFNTRDDAFYADEFEKLGCRTILATADGSLGVRGFVTDALPDSYSYFFACGPIPMLKALCKKTVTPGQVSLEERMGCGFGACMGCSVKTKDGYKRVCKDGPVLRKEELLWED